MLSIMASMGSRLSSEIFLFLSQDHNALCGIWLQKMLSIEERYNPFFMRSSKIAVVKLFFLITCILIKCWGWVEISGCTVLKGVKG
jgi:hypothetical protein